jgi:hypothetical protein
MAFTFGDYDAFPVNALGPWRVIATADFPIGASGAVGAIVGDPGISLVKADTGVYTLTYPPALRVKLFPSIKVSAATTVTEIIGTACDATAGTATLQTSKAGTATEPASGNILSVLIIAETR